MMIYPAIDLRGGRCVRLYQGDYRRETVYGDDPVAQARTFIAEGAEVLHVVDLDAARTGAPTNRSVIGDVVAAAGVPVQVGGGVRDLAAAEALFDLGVARVVIGTAALERPALVGELVDAGRSVAVGIDANGDEVATHGWTERTGRTTSDVAQQFADLGVEALVVTEIGRDGTMEGPDLVGLADLLATTATTVIASGGVGEIGHLEALRRLRSGGRSLAGVIVGRALYEGAFGLADAIRAGLEGD
ncbi:MAG: 1-(5-phosphoribosyl)-5-[(5-phosphoribosylamino)methylideneamino]imidazole-4-carboxamide isomerase [Acidimicrobiia bacterium]|nr:1-(5-phosphoribosyl)-5-[(5-phosphoribosylamino)methylideneamino]imidazole-4-carboxamide isomerase [Acidimicrobiia bacterium]